MIASAAKSSGFSMIEVMVSLLIIVVGVLGMVGLQSKAIPYTQDSVQRNNAIMLADDLMELIRSTTNCTSSNGCQKPPGAGFPAAPAICIPTPTIVGDDAATISKRLGCWAAQAMKYLPGVDAALLTNSYYICRSITPGDTTSASCGTSNNVDSEIEIQLAWKVKTAGDCMDPLNATTTCTYKLRTRL
jgi:type IV pilus assembly protein PilV